MIEEDLIECVIGLGPNLFYNSPMEACLLITKTNKTKDKKGKILFIEDLDEYLYHIDRMMMALKRAGILKDLTGLIVGGMTDMRDNEIPFGKAAYEIIREAVDEYNYPVCFGFPAGHQKENLPLIMGSEIILEQKNKATLRFFE